MMRVGIDGMYVAGDAEITTITPEYLFLTSAGIRRKKNKSLLII